MIYKIKDLTGQKFGRLTVKERVENAKDGRAQWLCECDCGGEHVTKGKYLLNGECKSCGCLSRENKERWKTVNYKHGGVAKNQTERLYSIWCGMKTRTTNKNQLSHYSYHDKGVSVCEEWFSDYQCFKEWALNNGYSDELTIDRIDNDGDYCPENCRWITQFDQNRNTSRTIRMIVNGEIYCLKDCCKLLGIKYRSVQHYMYRKNKNPLDAVKTSCLKHGVDISNFDIKQHHEREHLNVAA